MRIKLKNLYRLWFLGTVILTCICTYTVFQINALSENMDVEECMVEVQMAGLPNMSIVEKEEEVIIEKVVPKYEFPFEVADLGTMKVIGCCSDCIPTKEYVNMRSNEKVTAFASKKVLPEGTLIWIDGVGIRQIQSLSGNYDGIYVFYNSHSQAENLGEQELRIFEVLE